jgi:hypothetical protein
MLQIFSEMPEARRVDPTRIFRVRKMNQSRADVRACPEKSGNIWDDPLSIYGKPCAGFERYKGGPSGYLPVR